MDFNTLRLMMGASGGAEKLYVEDVFSTWLYTGNGSTQTITNGIDLSGEGGLVWIKLRGLLNGFSQTNHVLVDTANGAGNYLQSNTTNAVQNNIDTINQFNSNGFNVGSSNQVNQTSATTAHNYTSWTFRKAAKFFDVVTFTAGTNTNRRISHSLGSVPGFIVIKVTNTTSQWFVYHQSLGRSSLGRLNLTNAFTNQANAWGTADPTASDFGLDETLFAVDGDNLVAYLFAHDAGGFGDSGNDSVVKCGSFTTDGSGNATVNLDWEPQWVLYKASNTAQNWFISDNMRGMTTSSNAHLYPNLSNAEFVNTGSYVSLTATGFQTQLTVATTYIYIAIRRGPMKTPTDATKVFSTFARSGTGAAATITTPAFPVDFILGQERTAIGLNGGIAVDRLRGAAAYLRTPVTNAEGSSTAVVSALDSMTGFSLGASNALNGSSSTYANWIFRRAPGFFDVVAYTGTGSARTVSHNLGVAPELMIVKHRTSSTYAWAVYSITLGRTKALALNTANAESTYGAGTFWGNTDFTSSVFSLGNYLNTNENGSTYIAYLFASCPGVSKVGSYTGSSNDINVDCGFTNGARFVLIKRVNDTGSWFVWDTARGITSGNDPYLLLNSTAAEVTNTDYLDPYSAGFTVPGTNVSPGVNNPGDTFIFLAIA